MNTAVHVQAERVVDLHSGLTDAKPLEDKTAEATASAIKTIYHRSILDFPNRLDTDPGSEFKSVFAALMIEHDVQLRLLLQVYGKKGRHRQKSVVEHRNHAIGCALNSEWQA